MSTAQGTGIVTADAPRRTRFAKPVVGLIGGIGSGKSQVAELLRQQGGYVIAADEAGHEALRQPAIRQQVVDRWGTGVLNERGEIERRRLGAVVFADPAQRRELENLVFPWIERRCRDQMAAAEADPAVRFLVLDAAIMLEAGWSGMSDRILFVDTPRDLRLQRLAQQRRWTAQDLDARERAQLPLEEKLRHADGVVDNSGPLEATARQVANLLQQWRLAPAQTEEREEPESPVNREPAADPSRALNSSGTLSVSPARPGPTHVS